MQQVAIIVSLKEGAEDRALRLLAEGPPFDLDEAGFERHAVYVTRHEVVFVFEGREVEWNLEEIVDDAFHPVLQEALARWGELVDGRPRVARPLYAWASADAGPEQTR
ncbi:MAG TPA: hypothetical protein VFL41_12810 [Gaiellaceae bacterium]|nr:hypothetical protein [Gaiellaceae bacterium]